MPATAKRSNVRGTHLLLAIAMAVLLAACGGSAAEESSDDAVADGGGTEAGTASPDGEGECTETTSLSLSVPTVPPKYAQLVPWMAQELGFYADFCLDVEIIGFRTGSGALTALQSGETDIGLPSSNVAVVASGQGSPITIFGTPASNLPQLIMATGDITSCEDLAGNTIATEGPGGLGHYLFTVFLDTCGLDITNDVDVFAGAPGDFAALLDQGVVQAAALHSDDKGQIEAEFDLTLNVLQASAEFEPDFHYQSFVARQDWLADDANRDAAVRLMAAALSAQRFMSDPANRETVVNTGAELGGRPLDVVDAAYDLYFYPETCAEGLSPQKFEHTAELQVELGEMDEVPAFESLVDPSICDDAEALL